MSPAVKKKLLGVTILVLVTIVMQFIVKGGDVTLIWASIAAAVAACGYLYTVC